MCAQRSGSELDRWTVYPIAQTAAPVWTGARGACTLMGRLQVDPHGEQVGPEGAHREVVEAPAQPVATEGPLPLPGVVAGQRHRRPRPPPAAHQHPHPGVGLDVADVVRAAAVLGHDPEGVAVQAVTDRRTPRQAAGASGGLEQGVAGDPPAPDQRGPHHRVHQPALGEAHDPELVHRHGAAPDQRRQAASRDDVGSGRATRSGPTPAATARRAGRTGRASRRRRPADGPPTRWSGPRRGAPPRRP